MHNAVKSIGAACLAAAIAATSAAPVAAQGFSFGFGFNNGPSYHNSQDWRWRNSYPRHYYPRYPAPRYPVRGGVSIDIGPLHLTVSHIQRCEARFRSYDRRTDMYMGFDGRHHRCAI